MNRLNKSIYANQPDAENLLPLLALPEKVLQFGTGVLLRGLPDYFIHKANRQGVFNGRVVVVKSTSRGGADAFDEQEGLYTHLIRGIEDGVKVEEEFINASISRVLSAQQHWDEILDCATNPEMEVVISNTTEVGLVLDEQDKINATPPSSFPGKLVAFLLKRYNHFNGDLQKGMVIIPTELIPDNGKLLQSICERLAVVNGLDQVFIDWMRAANSFCSSLVDRIVPGKQNETDQQEAEQKLGYKDELMIMSECYSLWAIESGNPEVEQKLSFAGVNIGVVIAPDINKFRELKLRLLNGTHTFSCGLAYLAGFRTVKEAMENENMRAFVSELMVGEMAPCIIGESISEADALAFANQVIDRFSNPFIEHKWISITAQYTGKMGMRNGPMLQEWFRRMQEPPVLMSLGFAAYILFMQGGDYDIDDPKAGWFATGLSDLTDEELVARVLGNEDFWKADLQTLPGFAAAVTDAYTKLKHEGAANVLNAVFTEKQTA